MGKLSTCFLTSSWSELREGGTPRGRSSSKLAPSHRSTQADHEVITMSRSTRLSMFRTRRNPRQCYERSLSRHVSMPLGSGKTGLTPVLTMGGRTASPHSGFLCRKVS
jgi:hypothetical protein